MTLALADLVAIAGLLLGVLSTVGLPVVRLLIRIESRLTAVETITRACPGHPGPAAPPVHWRRQAKA